MIVDRIENAALYYPLGPGLVTALEYLARNDFSGIKPGNYELDGRRIYAVVQRYEPIPLEQAAWEAHRDYFDVQFVAQGAERMGYAALVPGLTVKQPYNPEKDMIFYEAGGSLIEFGPGDFAIFAPADIHAPRLLSARPSPSLEIIKVVVKVRIDQVTGKVRLPDTSG
ncbi:MAG: DUF386 domain-containing protein [Phycisphaerales bacterium]|nr:DUF386 domain-containing protein [Phycisphaerales bacterium]